MANLVKNRSFNSNFSCIYRAVITNMNGNYSDILDVFRLSNVCRCTFSSNRIRRRTNWKGWLRIKE